MGVPALAARKRADSTRRADVEVAATPSGKRRPTRQSAQSVDGDQSAAKPSEARASEPVRWLVLIYRVPSEPTRLRAAVWRRLKNLGAIYLQNSVAALPADHHSERALRTLRNEIVGSMKGRAKLLSSVAVVGDADLVTEFNDARNDEYEEILDKCQDFHAEIDKETAIEHFTYGELEEIEEDLTKLQRWYKKVTERDAFGASRAEAVDEALVKCSAALQEYASLVYQADTDAG